ncbi:hypothetical protein LAZ67_4003766, partial [Cordylochernes scorpioides]
MNPAKKKKKAYKPTTRIVNVADLEREDEMVISRNCSILSSIGHPALKSLHEDLIRYIASRTEMIKALATNVENLTDTLESFAELDEIEEANKPKTACRGTQTCPAPSCNETSSQTDLIKPATPAPAALPAKKPASSLPAPAPTKRKQSEAPNPPAKRTNLNGPSKPVPSHVSKPAAAQVILHGEKSAAHTVVISDDPQADPREMLKTVRAAHTLPQGVWASLRTKGKLVLHSSNPDTIPEVTTSLASKLNGMKVRQQKEILPRICLFKVDEETSNSTIEETFLETAAVRKLPGDKVVRVAHRSAPRNGTCTAFIEVDLKTFRALGVRGRIVVDGVILNFEESIRARVCFRCCGFGHNSAQCTRAPKCFHCGEDGHEGRTCPSIADRRTSKCANCCSQGLPDKHEARASSCPILKSRALNQLPRDKSVRVAHRSPSRNGTCMAFIELDLASYKAIGRRGRIIVDQVILNYEESVRVCYRCCGYGHNADRCTKATVTCFHCASGDHQGRSCPTLANPHTAKCTNCSAKGLSANHEARSMSCPTTRARAANDGAKYFLGVQRHMRMRRWCLVNFHTGGCQQGGMIFGPNTYTVSTPLDKNGMIFGPNTYTVSTPLDEDGMVFGPNAYIVSTPLDKDGMVFGPNTYTVSIPLDKDGMVFGPNTYTVSTPLDKDGMVFGPNTYTVSTPLDKDGMVFGPNTYTVSTPLDKDGMVFGPNTYTVSTPLDKDGMVFGPNTYTVSTPLDKDGMVFGPNTYTVSTLLDKDGMVFGPNTYTVSTPLDKNGMVFGPNTYTVSTPLDKDRMFFGPNTYTVSTPLDKDGMVFGPNTYTVSTPLDKDRMVFGPNTYTVSTPLDKDGMVFGPNTYTVSTLLDKDGMVFGPNTYTVSTPLDKNGRIFAPNTYTVSTPLDKNGMVFGPNTYTVSTLLEKGGMVFGPNAYIVSTPLDKDRMVFGPNTYTVSTPLDKDGMVFGPNTYTVSTLLDKDGMVFGPNTYTVSTPLDKNGMVFGPNTYTVSTPLEKGGMVFGP